MADPSSRVRSNSEFRERLMEKVQVNVTETGKLAQQLLKSSRSHEILTQTIKQFVSQEGALMNSQEQLKHCEKVITDMQKQFGDIQHSLQTVNRISEQLEPPHRLVGVLIFPGIIFYIVQYLLA
ncbi:unnamed protein product [Porites evermanni]|uniref:BLOC-1-related complex subunit 7 n=2 Tax=Porites TaxID=46719 RepID=A0ABN8MCM6_9CNID|nr:unnamed protein product [Porites evermanni]